VEPDQLSERRLEREKVREDVDDHRQLFRWIALHQREERCIERIRYFDLVSVLPQDKSTTSSIDLQIIRRRVSLR